MHKKRYIMASTKRTSKKKSTPAKSETPSVLRVRMGQVGLVLVAMIALYLFLALGTYDLSDPTLPKTAAIIHNQGGLIGAWVANVLFALLGIIAYIMPVSMLYYCFIHWHELRQRQAQSRLLSSLRLIGWILSLLSLSGLVNLLLDYNSWTYPEGPGGILGEFAPKILLPLFNFSGSIWALCALFFVGLTFFSGKMWVKHSLGLLTILILFTRDLFQRLFSRQAQATAIENDLPFVPDTPPTPTIKKPIAEPKAPAPPAPIKKAPMPRPMPPSGEPPSIDLLDDPIASTTQINKDQLNQTAQLIEQRLLDFGINAKITGICPGPVVTRYELQLAAGVKVSKLANLDKDLARSLSVSSVRVVEVIPGKTAVGLELPNAHREMVRLKEVLDSDAFRSSKSAVCMGLGKDISGLPEVVDLGKMPHLLVAGTTGSGKSVGLNAMLLSMLLKSGPQELRLIMIDPKMLELSIYEGIPHLLTPVVTDMKEAANALRWSVKEMDRRYRLMAALGVRNIAGFNEAVQAAIDKKQPIKDPIWMQLNPGKPFDCPTLTPLPYIVVLVDEFADMIMVVGKKVEELITRLAQKARAAGIHLIVATQRPSVDVITGLIKANIPTRIAFQVSSKIDSRTILDQQGAEQLLGNGDMLYLPVGSGVPIRVHGAYVSDAEVHRVVEAWRAVGEPEYLDSIIATDKLDGEDGESSEESVNAGEADPLYDEAVQIVIESKRASISLVQRRLRIGYNRAARLLEDMEKAGMVSEIQSNGLREVLVESN
jgi:S-DNA-T family DNA segregation ATPase FtsK/SpoIIIE